MDEIKKKLDEILANQQQQKEIIVELNAKVTPLEEDVWLTKEQVMEKLFIETRTFYRRKEKSNWVEEDRSGTIFYLESSLIIKK